eukprot:GFUD01030545.1.p1 GENE.GFUD01030545.1~~GFUD01030545.1.p1  ORF type:complete len:219 (+),score=79.44 GFUD01030545.1:98-754(+)
MVFSWLFGSKEATEPTPETVRGGYECAPYTILESHPEYQVRKYPSRKWATVLHEKQSHETQNDMPMSKEWKQQPQNKSFMKLFGYITGTNETGSKISMTVPVSTKVTTEEHEGGGVVMKEEMGFYVPSEHQDSTPPPKADQEVKIVTRPEMVAFVREFGGFAKDKDWQEQKEQLKKDLEGRDDFGQIDFEMYYRQGFDAPFKFWGRKNEVFFIKKTEE